MYSKRIGKAVIPAAGLGTRMQPLTKVIPKELLPVGELPMMHYSVLEAAAAGVEEIFIIINTARKQAIEDFYNGTNWRQLSHFPYDDFFKKEARDLQVTFLEQKEPVGLVDAVEKARNHIGDRPFFLLMPDNIFFGAIPPTVQLLDCFEEYKQNILALIEVNKAEADLYGNNGPVKLQPIEGQVFRIVELMDKSKAKLQTGRASRIIRTCGRFILTPDFFEEAGRFNNEVMQEQDEIPILQKFVQDGRMLGVLLEGKLYDCGNWQGYWAANQHWLELRRQWN